MVTMKKSYHVVLINVQPGIAGHNGPNVLQHVVQELNREQELAVLLANAMERMQMNKLAMLLHVQWQSIAIGVLGVHG